MSHPTSSHLHVPSPLHHSSPPRSTPTETRRGRVRRPTNAAMRGMGMRRLGSGLVVDRSEGEEGEEEGSKERIVDGNHLLDILSDLESTIAAHQLRLQTLQSTISHKLAEFPSITDRLRSFDDEAAGLLGVLIGPTTEEGASQTQTPITGSHSGALTDEPLTIGGSPPLVPTASPPDSPLELTHPTIISLNDPPPGIRGSTTDEAIIPAKTTLEDLQKVIETAEAKMDGIKGSLDQRKERVEEARQVFGRVGEIEEELKRRIDARYQEIAAIRARHNRTSLIIYWSIAASMLLFSAGLAYWYSSALPHPSQVLSLVTDPLQSIISAPK